MIDVIPMEIDSRRIPRKNEPVRSLIAPIRIGPTPPPRLPMELIKPMEPAAADSLRNKLGNDQNAGK